MARAKPKKWAAESLVSETESKAIASPEQQKMAGELTADMLSMMLPVPGGKKVVELAKKLFKGKGKGKAGKVSDKKLLELYQKAHPGAKVSKKPAKTSDDVLRAYNKAHPGAKVSKKAKGGSVKKYSSGGGVRAARF